MYLQDMKYGRYTLNTLRNETNFDVLYMIYCNLGQFTLIIREEITFFNYTESRVGCPLYANILQKF
jgi:hypothetical protein